MQSASKIFVGARVWPFSIVLAAACFLTYHPWTQFGSQQRVPILGEATRVAESLYRSGEFANPFGTLSTGYTAHLAPGYPLIVAALFWFFGDGQGGWRALICLPVVAMALQLALLPWLARMLTGSPWVGVCAAVFGLLTRPVPYEQWEAQVAGLMILVLTILVWGWAHNEYSSVRAAVVGGIAGITFYVQPAFAPVYAGWIIVRVGRAIFRDFRTIPLWATPLLICAPWIARNQVRLGTPLLRDNLGIELNVSFNDCAPYAFELSQEQGCFGQVHPNQNLDEAMEVRRLGEVAYNRSRMDVAVRWARLHLGRVAVLIIQRTVHFWFPSNDRWPTYLRDWKRTSLVWVLTLASFVGILQSRRANSTEFSILAMLMGCFPLIYYVVQYDPRYRYPILWVTWFEAARFCFWFLAKRRPHPSIYQREF